MKQHDGCPCACGDNADNLSVIGFDAQRIIKKHLNTSIAILLTIIILAGTTLALLYSFTQTDNTPLAGEKRSIWTRPSPLTRYRDMIEKRLNDRPVYL